MQKPETPAVAVVEQRALNQKCRLYNISVKITVVLTQSLYLLTDGNNNVWMMQTVFMARFEGHISYISEVSILTITLPMQSPYQCQPVSLPQRSLKTPILVL